MTSIRAELAKLLPAAVTADIPGAPAADFHVTPGSLDEAAAVLAFASRHHLAVLFYGAGTHQGMGYPVTPDMVLSTSRLGRIVDWQPDDLTVIVEAGCPVAELEETLAGGGQTAVLPESPGASTVGGTVAAGISGWRRFRYGPTRDRMLEVLLATGDGRVVRGGAPVVKNVTGYDLPRLAAGSFGSLGLIGRVCLKLWPLGRRAATVRVGHRAETAAAFRPLAVIEDPGGVSVFLAATPAEIEAQVATLGGDVTDGLAWPSPIETLHRFVLRVPARLTADAVTRIRRLDHVFLAAHGVGEIRFGDDTPDLGALGELRRWAEANGGALVVEAAPDGYAAAFDPWGAPPPSIDLQRRVKDAFDPVGIANPGRLPGRL
jgi:glycolate oxidase FAD binding subunit